MPTTRHAISTTTVPWMTWFWPGHSTFLSSAQDSAMKFERLRSCAGCGCARLRARGCGALGALPAPGGGAAL